MDSDAILSSLIENSSIRQAIMQMLLEVLMDVVENNVNSPDQLDISS